MLHSPLRARRVTIVSKVAWMRVLVMGAGGMGGFLGARMAQAGHDVTLVVRGAHFEVIQRDGLTIRMDEGDDRYQIGRAHV